MCIKKAVHCSATSENMYYIKQELEYLVFRLLPAGGCCPAGSDLVHVLAQCYLLCFQSKSKLW